MATQLAALLAAYLAAKGLAAVCADMLKLRRRGHSRGPCFKSFSQLHPPDIFEQYNDSMQVGRSSNLTYRTLAELCPGRMGVCPFSTRPGILCA